MKRLRSTNPLVLRKMAKSLRGNAQRTVELARQVLKRNQCCKLDDGVVVEMSLQLLHQFFINCIGVERNDLSIFEAGALPIGKEAGSLPAAQSFDLVGRHAAFKQRR